MTQAATASGPRIVIAAGGTAGHVVPAIAVADALRAEGAEVLFVGGERAERELVPAAGHALETIRVEGISRTNPLKAARAAGKAALALRAASAILARHEADAVLGAGGYVAGPVGLAAVRRRIPLVLAEADSHLGLTNRLLARRARRVCLAFAIPGREGERYRVTGRPVPATIGDRAGARAQLGLAPDDTVVLVFGGSLGARSINHAAPEAFADAPYRVLHVAGRRTSRRCAPRRALRAARLRRPLRPRAGGRRPRGGALRRLGLRAGPVRAPAVLIPYPHATGDHQTSNARWMEDAGAAVVIADAELTAARLCATVDGLPSTTSPARCTSRWPTAPRTTPGLGTSPHCRRGTTPGSSATRTSSSSTGTARASTRR